MTTTVKPLPVLYGKSKTGKIKEWEISVMEHTNGNVFIVTSHGYKNGKKQVDKVEIKSGKNIGKANETTKWEQGLLEANAKWNLKKDKGYGEDINNIPKPMLPMLAKKFKDYKHKIVYPCYVQPKLDGVRCLAKRVNGNIEFCSRGGKRFTTVDHLDDELKCIMEVGDIVDGEIYVHGENFQDIISALKNVKSKSKATLDCELLEFHIYDVADDGFSFQHRWKVFENKFKDVDGYIYFDFIKLVPTYIATNENDIHAYHKQFVEEGYEGVIIRNRDGKYEFKHRSNNLQKLKFFHDEEYKIIGVKSGTGRYENCGTFICETKDGKTFDCNMKGTIEQKEEFLSNKDYYIGKLLTVKYQEKSKDNIPRFPVGISVRDYE